MYSALSFIVFLCLEKVAEGLAKLQDKIAFVILACMEERDLVYSFHEMALNARLCHL